MTSLLRRRDFGLLWSSGFISEAGDRVLVAALPFFVYQRTGSTVATAGMVAAELVPSIVIGPAAGVIVDRVSRKRVIVAANLVQAILVSALLLVAHGGPLWILYVVGALLATAAAFAGPAESALLPSLVGPDELLAANALTALANRLGRVIGMPLGGVLLGFLGLDAVVVVDAASFAVAAVLVAPVRAPAGAGGDVETRGTAAALARFGSLLTDGLRLIARDRPVAVLTAVLVLMTFGGTMLDPLVVAWVRDVLGQGPQVYALLTTAHAASGIVVSLVLVRVHASASPRLLAGWSSVAAGAALLVKFDVPLLPLAFALSLVGGAVSVAGAIGVQTLVQQAVADDFRGRVFGSLQALISLASLAGAMLGGVLGEVVGTVPMLNVASSLVLASGLVALWALDGSPVWATPSRAP